MWGELREVFDEVAANRDDRVLVITGAGDGFCSGADLVDAGMPRRAPGPRSSTCAGSGGSAARCTIPQADVAKVNGVAAGAGLNLALGCDLVIASDRARFSEIFVQRGLSIDFGGSWLLPRLVGHAQGEGARAARRGDRRRRGRAHRHREPRRGRRRARRAVDDVVRRLLRDGAGRAGADQAPARPGVLADRSPRRSTPRPPPRW